MNEIKNALVTYDLPGEISINDLPEETLQHIFSFALSNDPINLHLLSLRFTCKKWKNVSGDPYLLKHLCKSHFVNISALSEEKNEEESLTLIKDFIQPSIAEYNQIDSCEDLLKKNKGNFQPEIIQELSELRDLYNLEILISEIAVIDPFNWKDQNDYETLSNNEKLKLINTLLNEKKEFVGKFLDLSDKKLTALPREIGLFSNLQILKLNDNLLVNLPPEIGQLSNLERLDLSVNRLKSLPSEIGALPSLERLRLSYNALTSLPPEIGQLNNLERLFLHKNQLEGLSSTIGALSFLKKLDLHKNKLTSLPSEIGQLSRLKDLNLSENKLESLPAEIGSLSALKVLCLGINKLTSLPREMSQLNNVSLHLSKSQLESLRTEIEALSLKTRNK